MELKLFNQDNIELLKTLPDNSIDSIVTDPPYGISFMGKKWDYDVPSVATWVECMRVLKPGGHILVACGTRTQHRMAVNIEDAGFEIRDIVAWIYGSGFPKSLNIGKALDKKPEVLNTKAFKTWLDEKINSCGKTKKEINDECGFTATSYSKTDGKDYWSSCFPTADKWQKMKEVIGLSDEFDFVIRNNIEQRGYIEPTGNLHKGSGDNIMFSGKQLSSVQIEHRDWAGWGTALKPAMELWTLARKPLSENNVASNVLKWGTGGINIDGSRVEVSDNEKESFAKEWDRFQSEAIDGNVQYVKQDKSYDLNQNRPTGRFPANVIHDGSDEVTDLFPNTKSQGHWSKTKTTGFGKFGNGRSVYEGVGEKDKQGGSASRFFYCAKASKSERNAGLDGFEEKFTKTMNDGIGGREHNENEPTAYNKNHHPTVKPVALMRYLVKLITPTGGMVLDPFMGSGSTGVACMKENFNFTGIELDPDYFKIAEARISNLNK